MSADKVTTVYGLMLKTEASYAAGGAVAAADDGVELAEEAYASEQYAQDGARPQAGAGGPNVGGQPSGRSVELPIRVEGRGAGAAYSGSVFSKNLHRPLLIAGHTATLDATAGAEKYTYAPITPQTGVVPSSGVAEAYARGEKLPLVGAYASWEFEIEAGGFWMHRFNLMAVLGADPSDVALPAITYPTVVGPKAEGMAISVTPSGSGAWTTGHWRRIRFQQGRVISPRLDGAAGGAFQGHAGFAMGRCEPQLVITFEQALKSAINWDSLRRAATKCAISFAMGTGGTPTYNRQEFAAGQGQVVAVGPGADGAVGLVDVTFRLAASTPILSDYYTFITK